MTELEQRLSEAVKKLKRLRGPFIGDGVNPGLNAYELASDIEELLMLLRNNTQAL